MKKEQKVIIADNSWDVNQYLDKGWYVVSVTAAHLTSFKYFCFVIEREVM